MATSYRDGTVAVTNGSANVTGTDTLFAAAIMQGDQFYVPGGQFYEVVTVTDDTHIVLDRAYQGTTQSALGYLIFRTSPLRGQVSNLATRLSDFVTKYTSLLTSAGGSEYFGPNRTTTSGNAGMVFKTAGAALISMGLMGYGSADTDWSVKYLSESTWAKALVVDPVSGQVRVRAGTQALPGWAVIGDSDTGIWADAANSLSFVTGANYQLRITDQIILRPTSGRVLGPGQVFLDKQGNQGNLHWDTGNADIFTGGALSLYSPYGALNGIIWYGLAFDIDHYEIAGHASTPTYGGLTSFYGVDGTTNWFATTTSGVNGDTVTVNNIMSLSRTGVLTLTGTSSATSVSTGALRVAGGVGIVENLVVGGKVRLGDASSVYPVSIYGLGQTTGAWADDGPKGGSLYIQDGAGSSGAGGALLLGTAFGHQLPFAMVKAYVIDGTAGSVGDLLISLRHGVNDEHLTERARFHHTGGVTIGSPTGGDKGAGSLNAVAIYDDNVLLTDYVFDRWAGRAATYSGRLATLADALDQEMFDPAKYAAHFTTHHRLWGMPDLNDVIDGVVNGVSLGGMVQKLWQTAELNAIHVHDIDRRLRALETAA